MDQSTAYKSLTTILESELECSKIRLIENSSLSTISQCITCETDKGLFFAKCLREDASETYASEAFALETIQSTRTVKVPTPYFQGEVNNLSFLILEYIDLYPHTNTSQQILGQQLATLHQSAKSKMFGFSRNNTIGATPQVNDWSADWVVFFKTYRINYLMELLDKKYQDIELSSLTMKLLKKIPSYFRDLTLTPSLLHGDLWNGNTAADKGGKPVMFDPASYYGHDECDLSIAMIFGGFHSSFFSAYHEIIPKRPGFEERILLYQLYHYMNHYLIFGSSYRQACIKILKALS